MYRSYLDLTLFPPSIMTLKSADPLAPTSGFVTSRVHTMVTSLPRNKICTALVDMGSSINAISLSTLHKLYPEPPPLIPTTRVFQSVPKKIQCDLLVDFYCPFALMIYKQLLLFMCLILSIIILSWVSPSWRNTKR